MSRVQNKKVWRAILISLVVLYLIVFPAQAKYSGGSGTADDPYQIATADDVMLLGETSEDYDKYFTLTADIDLDPNLPGRKVFERAVIAPDVEGKQYFQGTAFTGTFDGNGKRISRLTIDGGSYLGLFGLLDDAARISSLAVEAADVSGIGDYVGGFASWNRGIISNCHSTGTVSGDMYVGGLVGRNAYYHSGTEPWVVYSGVISMSYSTGTVSGDVYVGGLVGGNSGGTGVSYSTADVSGGSNVGGLAGKNEGGNVDHCYSTGNVRGSWNVGGLVGHNPTGRVVYCYSAGGVSGGRNAGGLVGNNASCDNECEGRYCLPNCTWGTTKLSFWDTGRSDQVSSAGGIGMTTTEMQTASTFLEAGWDFVDETANGPNDIWKITEGLDYPRLWWEFGQAFSPQPQDGAIDVIEPVIINWLPGGPGLNHDVYFGEDEEVVTNATTESPEVYRGRHAAETTTYDPGTLELAKTYYWRIDEVNDADPNSQWKGNVWSFTTGNFVVVDDFESYNDIDPPDPESHRIFDIWIDGWFDPNNGSVVGYAFNFAEQTIAHSGWLSMPFLYDNSGLARYSEATAHIADLEIGRDWTIEDVVVLSLWFRGVSANAPEPMYVALNGTAAVYHDDTAATQLTGWKEWTIDLSAFGVDLTNVNSITIGIGTKNTPAAGGTGRVYFDDIRLYRP